MSDWEKVGCLLCHEPAIRHVFKEPRGWKYDRCAGGCPSYAAKFGVHEHIRLYIKEPEQRKSIIDLVKRRTSNGSYEGRFYEIKSDDLRELGLFPAR